MTGVLSRRRFLAASVGGVLAGVCRSNVALAAPEDAEWAFPLLGDLHFDRIEHHDMGWLEREHPGDVAQVRNYSQVTSEFTPRLLEVVREQVGRAGAMVPFVVQLGDFVEGLCGSEALAARQGEEALAFVRSMNFRVPFLFTKGNHDITGPGAPEVFDRTFVPFLTGAGDERRQKASYIRERGGTLIVFYDAYDRGSLDWFENLMAERTPRRLLFVIHPPVVPYNARSDWHVYSHERQGAQRKRLLELLGASGAVVLSGHLHKYSYLVRRTEAGWFTQLGLSSVATSPGAEPRNVREGVEHYGESLLDLEPAFSPDTKGRRAALLEAERPFIDRFEYAETWGHAVVRMGGDQVTAEVCRGLETATWKRLDLAGAA